MGYIDLTKTTPSDLAYMILEKLGKRDEIDEMISFLLSRLPSYSIEVRGANLAFDSSEHDFYGEVPVRLLLEMYRLDQLEDMFILPAIVPN